MPMQEKNLVQMTLLKWLEFQINMHVQVYYSIVNITFSNFKNGAMHVPTCYTAIINFLRTLYMNA